MKRKNGKNFSIVIIYRKVSNYKSRLVKKDKGNSYAAEMTRTIAYKSLLLCRKIDQVNKFG